MGRLRLTTYNLWHGLTPSHWVRFKTLEPATRKSEREQMQYPLLKELDADAYFLQEMNPVQKRASEFASKLERNKFWSRDNAGIKLAGIGPPYNLDSGLGIFLHPRHIPDWSKALCLSGEKYSAMNKLGSIQWAESRYALLVSTVSPELGRVLWVSTHLHHGLEMRESVLAAIQEKVESRAFSANIAEELKDRISSANQRRESEVETLLNQIDQLKDRYSLILMGGDFNCTHESKAWKNIESFGFQPLQTQGPDQLLSWDSEVNLSNHMIVKDMDSPVLVDDLSFDEQVVRDLKVFLKTLVMDPRQIDFIWGWSNTGQFKVHQSYLFGAETEVSLAPSDHLGLFSEIEWSAS